MLENAHTEQFKYIKLILSIAMNKAVSYLVQCICELYQIVLDNIAISYIFTAVSEIINWI